NHHAYGTSAKFSSKWYEFDLGWVYISILRFFKLATVKKVAPKLRLEPVSKAATADINLDTLQGVITHRYEILARYADVIRQAASEEIARLKNKDDHSQLSLLKRCKDWIGRGDEVLDEEQRAQLQKVLNEDGKLSTVVQMQVELARLWESSSATSEQLLADLRAWVQRAQQSGIDSLEQFALRLRRYAA
ncbi:MAG: acyl-CoA desaturase, partial [Alcaligenaceae bacterium]|nr:acyl-CoA desaturase [Alcaligenaceae bacterium]